MNQIAYPPVQQALEKLKTLSRDDDARRLAFVRERALHDEISQLSAAKLEGRQEEAQVLIRRLLNKRFGSLSVEVQQRIDQATTEQLEIWTDNILDATTINAVFGS